MPGAKVTKSGDLEISERFSKFMYQNVPSVRTNHRKVIQTRMMAEKSRIRYVTNHNKSSNKFVTGKRLLVLVSFDINEHAFYIQDDEFS